MDEDVPCDLAGYKSLPPTGAPLALWQKSRDIAEGDAEHPEKDPVLGKVSFHLLDAAAPGTVHLEPRRLQENPVIAAANGAYGLESLIGSRLCLDHRIAGTRNMRGHNTTPDLRHCKAVLEPKGLHRAVPPGVCREKGQQARAQILCSELAGRVNADVRVDLAKESAGLIAASGKAAEQCGRRRLAAAAADRHKLRAGKSAAAHLEA
mmetsp:Transcript_67039/g.143433  ORF Transcript_67039/g.143433 Transcript_67039/m.143433 type:complete len:207 (+) Transcript_67039:561-1181(+)